MRHWDSWDDGAETDVTEDGAQARADEPASLREEVDARLLEPEPVSPCQECLGTPCVHAWIRGYLLRGVRKLFWR